MRQELTMLDETETPTTPAESTGDAVGRAADQAPTADGAPVKKTVKKAAKRAPAKRAAKKAPAAPGDTPGDMPGDMPGDTPGDGPVDGPSDGPRDTPTDVSGAATAERAAPRAAKKTAAKKSVAKKTAAKKASAEKTADAGVADSAAPAAAEDAGAGQVGAPAVLFQAPDATAAKKAAKKTAKKAPAKRATKKAAPEAPVEMVPDQADTADQAAGASPEAADTAESGTRTRRSPRTSQRGDDDSPRSDGEGETGTGTEAGDQADAGSDDSDDSDDSGAKRRPRRRGGRRRRKPADGEAQQDQSEGDSEDSDEQNDADADANEGDSAGSRRRRRRRRSGEGPDNGGDDPENTVVRVRKPRRAEDEIASVSGSTRLEAKKQRRREGREAGRRRAPIVSEAEFLARRESVDRVMVMRQRADLTQIGVLEDKVLVEHYVARESQTSLIGNVYLGKVQNVLPSMEAAFVDIGMGRNAVIYAGEVNWSALGNKDGQARKIESVLKSGQTILVQVSKDPIGHKGARLTGQISLPGRFLVYVPDGNTSGISRKLPDTERHRLKTLLKEIVPDTAGVIVRTAAEGASEDELTQDVERLTARWSDIEAKVKDGRSPQLLYGEPDLTLKVVRDLFTEDFARLVVQGDDAWDLVDGYVSHVAPDLRDRLERFEVGADGKDIFDTYRVTEQIAKGLDRKVWLPSGGSLVIDRTEAMTVVDVNTGKFTGSGGNLEETVTKNNLEAAEEIVRQLRLRDIGGIIVVDFIDMVLESNRDLVLRRLVECLGRDRTRHQVAEVTSLGLVQMTRKRIGTGLLEAFGQDCEHCKGRGVVVHDHPIEESSRPAPSDDGGRRGRGGRNRNRSGQPGGQAGSGNGGPGHDDARPSPKDLAGSRPHRDSEEASADPSDADQQSGAGIEEAPVRAVDETITTEPLIPADPAPEAEPEPEPEAEPEREPVAPAAPRVVTTRRRSARRPAGPPAAVTPAIETPAIEPASIETSAIETPAVDSATPTDGFDPDLSEVPGDGDSLLSDEADDESANALFHVPVKRKGGARKR